MTMLENLSAGRPVRVFCDEFRMPVCVTNLCDILLEFARRGDTQGIYHVGGRDRLTRLELGRMLCDAFDLPRDLLIPVRQQDVPSREPRPQDCTFRTDKARSVLATPIWSTAEALRHMRQRPPHAAPMPEQRSNAVHNTFPIHQKKAGAADRKMG